MTGNIRRIEGFTLLEMTVCLAMITLFTLLTLPLGKRADLSHYAFMDKYQYLQCKALCNGECLNCPNEYSLFPIYFNEKGNINMGQSVTVNRHFIVIHLGNGYLTYE